MFMEKGKEREREKQQLASFTFHFIIKKVFVVVLK